MGCQAQIKNSVRSKIYVACVVGIFCIVNPVVAEVPTRGPLIEIGFVLLGKLATKLVDTYVGWKKDKCVNSAATGESNLKMAKCAGLVALNNISESSNVPPLPEPRPGPPPVSTIPPPPSDGIPYPNPGQGAPSIPPPPPNINEPSQVPAPSQPPQGTNEKFPSPGPITPGLPGGVYKPAPVSNELAGMPTAPYIVPANGKPNYAGVGISLVVVNDAGVAIEQRPVSASFRTGERFKIKLISSFEGIVEIDTINPRGVRSRTYPENSSLAVLVHPREEIFLPRDLDETFQFSGDTGQEKLIVSVRDPAALNRVLKPMVYRSGTEAMTQLIQPLANGEPPSIAVEMVLSHSR